MKKNLILLTALLFVCNFVSAAESSRKDEKQSEQRTIQAFTEVSVSHGINLYLTQDKEISLRAEATPEFLALLKTEVKGNTLKIYLERKGKHFKDIDVDVHLSYVELNRLEGSGGADIETVNKMNSETLNVNLSSGSDLKMQLAGHSVQLRLSSGSDAEMVFEGKIADVQASSGSDLEMKADGLDKMKISMSSGSDVDLDGSSAELVVNASSGSDLDAYGFVAVNADVNASSASDLKLTVVGELHADASSASSISYKGNVKNPNVHTSSLGSVCGK